MRTAVAVICFVVAGVLVFMALMTFGTVLAGDTYDTTRGARVMLGLMILVVAFVAVLAGRATMRRDDGA